MLFVGAGVRGGLLGRLVRPQPGELHGLRKNRCQFTLVPCRRRPGTATATANDDDYTGCRVLFFGSGVRGGVLGRLVQPQ